MSPNFVVFVQQEISNFITAITNLFIFLPYFFSVRELIKTLFAPWKALTIKTKKPGFSFSVWFNDFTFNVTSRLVGAMVRFSIILSYLLIQTFFVIAVPFLFLSFLFMLPILYVIALTTPTAKNKQDQKRNAFVKTHMLEEKNQNAVFAWYESLYDNVDLLPWWHLKRLLSSPPLARDFTAGYTPALDQYSVELTIDFEHYKVLVGRSQEIAQIEQALTQTESANVILVGEEGVGKHIIIESLAKHIYEGSSNPLLAYKRILKIDLEKILAKEEEFVKREQILKEMFEEAVRAKNIIIFIEDLDRYVSPSEGRIDLSTVIAQYAGGEHLQFISVTATQMYQKYIFANDRIAGLFVKLNILEVSKEQTLQIILREVSRFEKNYPLIIPFETIAMVVEKADVYITSAPFPEKAISLLDELCALAASHHKKIILPEMVGEAVSQKTHIPTEVTENMKTELLHLDEELTKRVIGQDEAIHKIASTMRKSFVLTQNRKKLIASFLFLGPTGVGKTETAKALAETFFKKRESLLRFDMSLYQSKENIPQLVGSQQSGEPGLLTSAIRQNPYGVLLLDEMEKANHDLLNIFLTVLDEGYFTDGFGERVDCRNLIVIATSNAGAEFIYEAIAKSQGGAIQTTLIDFLVKNGTFSPEFLNRFDDVILYKPLESKVVETLARRMINAIIESVAQKHGIQVAVSDQYIQGLIARGYNPQFGARNLARLIRDEIEDEVAQQILEKKIAKGGNISF